MKAWQIDAYRGPLHLADVPEPVLEPHDVLVEVHAAALNVADLMVGRGEFKAFLPAPVPLTYGQDLAGVVTAVGPAVTRFAVGDEVFGCLDVARPGGTMTERVAVAESDLARTPAGLSMVEAASLPLVSLTAWQVLVERAHVRPGQRVLVHAGSGGLGSVAVQIAKHLGATVATTTGTSNVEWVRALGADQVVDHRTQDFAELVHDQDLVLDGLGGEVLDKSFGVLRRGGQVVGVKGPPDRAFAKSLGLSPVLQTVMGVLSLRTNRRARKAGVRYSFLFMHSSGAQLEQIAALVDDGVLRPVVDRVYPFAETDQAYAHLATGRAKGKVVVSVRSRAGSGGFGDPVGVPARALGARLDRRRGQRLRGVGQQLARVVGDGLGGVQQRSGHGVVHDRE
ncbi:NADP-dependent oxidoreductase [Klenkia terrae]|uniref:NADP-dependent oxidoreductase n=1 Tax=Klenkia terrae TaxID=1052259 RepID=A0ABU8E6L6_9ACTN|nr:NADP-dependent oxidoreductase [Klenkia terrae]